MKDSATIRIEIEMPITNKNPRGEALRYTRELSLYELQQLWFLSRDKALERLLTVNPDLYRYEMIHYQQQNEIARNIVRGIGDAIANELARAINKYV